MTGFRQACVVLLASLCALGFHSSIVAGETEGGLKNGCWCMMPHNENKLPAGAAALARATAVPQRVPNNTPASAQVLPLGFAPGQDIDVTVSGNLATNPQQDFYRVTLAKGDVLGAAAQTANFDSTLELDDVNGAQILLNDDGIAYKQTLPKISPFPVTVNPTDAVVTYIAPGPMDVLIRVAANPRSGKGAYSLPVSIRKPFLTTQPSSARQIIWLDFTGPTINPFQIFGQGQNGPVTVSPMRAFLTKWGLTGADENAIIDKVQAVVKRRFDELRLASLNGDRPTDKIPGHYDVDIRNSRDFPQLFGLPNVSRIIVGGTVAETQLQTIGLSSSIDPGNFKTDDTAIVLLDILSNPFPDPVSVNTIPLAPGYQKADAVALAIGQICTHEAGHFLGNWHTQIQNSIPSIMDRGGDLPGLLGVGVDGTLGTADDIQVGFSTDFFQASEGIGQGNNLERTDVNTAFGLSTGGIGIPGGGSLEPRPDLVVVAVNPPSTPLIAGQPFTVTAQIFNRGTSPAGDFFVALFLDRNTPANSSAGSAVPPVLVKGPLAAGDTVSIVFPPIVYPTAGRFTLAVLADSENNVLESNHQNNMFFLAITILQPGTDLLFASVNRVEIIPGIQYRFDLVVQNNGGTVAGPFNVGFYANRFAAPNIGDPPDQSVTLNGLAPGAIVPVSFTLPAQNVPRAGTAWFFADYTNVVPEVDKTNNVASSTWGIANDAPVIVSQLFASTDVASADPSDPPVTFTVVATDPNGDLLNYAWDFGDGSTLINGPTVTHKFNTPGQYTITVSVSDGPFHTVTSSVTLLVVADPIVDLGKVSLSANRGRVRIKLTLPSPFIIQDRVKSAVISGNPGDKVKYRNLVLSGTNKLIGVKQFTIEFQARSRPVLKRVRYKYTVVN